MRGFIETLTGSGQAAQAMPTNVQAANQRGGMASPVKPSGSGDGKGGFPWLAVGGLVGGLLSKPKAPSTPKAPEIPPQVGRLTGGYEQSYGSLLGQALGGQMGYPQPYYQQQVSQGMAALAAQSAQQRQLLTQALASRGMLRSGAEERGLRGIGEAQMAGQSNLLTQLAMQDLEARRAGQLTGMGQYQNLLGLASGQALSAQQLDMAQQAAYQQQQQQWLNTLGGLASAYAMYQYGQPGAAGGLSLSPQELNMIQMGNLGGLTGTPARLL